MSFGCVRAMLALLTLVCVVQLKSILGDDQSADELFRLQGHPVHTNGNAFITHGLKASYYKATTMPVAELMATPPMEADKHQTVGILNFEVCSHSLQFA